MADDKDGRRHTYSDIVTEIDGHSESDSHRIINGEIRRSSEPPVFAKTCGPEGRSVNNADKKANARKSIADDDGGSIVGDSTLRSKSTWDRGALNLVPRSPRAQTDLSLPPNRKRTSRSMYNGMTVASLSPTLPRHSNASSISQGSSPVSSPPLGSRTKHKTREQLLKASVVGEIDVLGTQREEELEQRRRLRAHEREQRREVRRKLEQEAIRRRKAKEDALKRNVHGYRPPPGILAQNSVEDADDNKDECRPLGRKTRQASIVTMLVQTYENLVDDGREKPSSTSYSPLNVTGFKSFNPKLAGATVSTETQCPAPSIQKGSDIFARAGKIDASAADFSEDSDKVDEIRDRGLVNKAGSYDSSIRSRRRSEADDSGLGDTADVYESPIRAPRRRSLQEDPYEQPEGKKAANLKLRPKTKLQESGGSSSPTDNAESLPAEIDKSERVSTPKSSEIKHSKGSTEVYAASGHPYFLSGNWMTTGTEYASGVVPEREAVASDNLFNDEFRFREGTIHYVTDGNPEDGSLEFGDFGPMFISLYVDHDAKTGHCGVKGLLRTISTRYYSYCPAAFLTLKDQKLADATPREFLMYWLVDSNKSVSNVLDDHSNLPLFIRCEDHTSNGKMLATMEKSDTCNHQDNFKFGIIYLRNDTLNDDNEIFSLDYHPSQSAKSLKTSYHNFLNYMGTRIQLSGFKGFAGGLDVKGGNTTGKQSIVSQHGRSQIMFHVSTLLPGRAINPGDTQHIQRKRHIGNDILSFVYIDTQPVTSDLQPFDPECIKSHFLHVYIIVRPASETQFRVHVIQMNDLPPTSWDSVDGCLYDADASFGEKMAKLAVEMTESAFHASAFKKLQHRTHTSYVEATCGTLLDEYVVIEKRSKGFLGFKKVPRRRLSSFRKPVSGKNKDKVIDARHPDAIDCAFVDSL